MTDLRVVLANNIRKARERLGLRQEDLAQRIGVGSGEIISKIELGLREVKAWELSRIAQALGVEFQELLNPRGPALGPAPLWRKQATTGRVEIEALLRLRSQRYRQVMELTGSLPTAELPWQDTLDVAGASYGELYYLAETLRRQLELGDVPTLRLFDALESGYGVMIFYQDLGDEGSAVSVVGPFGPAMLLNRREPPWRRNFSAAHELFHLITWNAMPRERLADEPELFEAIEQRADVFASALLLPKDSLLKAVEARASDHQLTISEIIAIAREFGVSTAALLWRLANLGVIPRQTTTNLLRDSAFRRADRATMSAFWCEPENLPKRMVELAFIAYQTGKLSRARLAEILETDLDGLPDVLAQYGLDMEFDAVYQAQIAPS